MVRSRRDIATIGRRHTAVKQCRLVLWFEGQGVVDEFCAATHDRLLVTVCDGESKVNQRLRHLPPFETHRALICRHCPGIVLQRHVRAAQHLPTGDIVRVIGQPCLERGDRLVHALTTLTTNLSGPPRLDPGTAKLVVHHGRQARGKHDDGSHERRQAMRLPPQRPDRKCDSQQAQNNQNKPEHYCACPSSVSSPIGSDTRCLTTRTSATPPSNTSANGMSQRNSVLPLIRGRYSANSP